MTEAISGRLVLEDGEALGRVVVDGEHIAAVEHHPTASDDTLVVPGFIDVHVHGWGGYDAMGGIGSLSGMARALAGRGVTSFLPTSLSATYADLTEYADSVRRWMPEAPGDGAEPLGFNMEGPFLSESKKGAHPAHLLRDPADIDEATLETFIEGLRIITVAPELPGALDMIRALAGKGVRVSLGHSAASAAQARAGYEAGAVNTTHLFNAMIGAIHREPGLALAALLDDDVWVELIADTLHVDPELWPLIWRMKPADRVVVISDGMSLAGSGQTRGYLGELEVRVDDGRCTLVDGGNLAGSVSALDLEMRNLVKHGVPLPDAVRATSTNAAQLLGLEDRGQLAAGLRADLVELDAASFAVRRVMRGGEWIVS